MPLGNPDHAIGAIAVRTPPGIDLRPAGRDDLEPAVAMARAMHGHAAVRDVESLRPRFEALIGDVDAVPFLATEAGQALGLGVIQFRRRLNFPTFEGWISELYVRPESRRRGVGRALLDGLVAEWRLRGSHRLQAKVPAGADDAAALLASTGFEGWMIDFRLRPLEHPAASPLPNGVLIRPLGLDDVDAVTSLVADFGPARAPAPERMDAVLRVFHEHARRVSAGSAASSVAERDGDVVGVCTLEWQRPYWTDDTHAWLPDLVVGEHARRRGIGRALVADALARAHEIGASQLSLESGPRRMAAHALYRSMGFEDVGRTYLLRRTEAT
jgi:GNAT superfamily N-acetyltransferase